MLLARKESLSTQTQSPHIWFFTLGRHRTTHPPLSSCSSFQQQLNYHVCWFFEGMAVWVSSRSGASKNRASSSGHFYFCVRRQWIVAHNLDVAFFISWLSSFNLTIAELGPARGNPVTRLQVQSRSTPGSYGLLPFKMLSNVSNLTFGCLFKAKENFPSDDLWRR